MLVNTDCIQESEHGHHLWWCPTGPFTFLPLHAAQSLDGKQTTADFVISSYTPTLDMLIAAQSSDTKISDPNMTVVIQSEVEGQEELPSAIAEYYHIQDAVPAGFM